MAVATESSAVACSQNSFEEAIQIAVDRAIDTSGDVAGAWVKDQQVIVEKGKIVRYCVHLRITYRS